MHQYQAWIHLAAATPVCETREKSKAQRGPADKYRCPAAVAVAAMPACCRLPSRCMVECRDRRTDGFAAAPVQRSLQTAMKNCSALVIAGLLLLAPSAGSAAGQSHLQPVVNTYQRALEFDWPLLHIGTAEYAEGPTGLTVIHFQKKVLAAVDVRGGAPSSVNNSFLDLGYDFPELDAVVFAGGSWYGLEAVTAVSSALKDDGLRDGKAFGEEPNIALSIGSIIFDFGSRRLNEIYPDKQLAQAAFRAARPGLFPLGAQGAGRMAKSGGFFGCNAFSGQGAAMRQAGAVKVAAFVVVNAYGLVTDRDGRPAACYPDASWPEDWRTADLLVDFPAVKEAGWSGPGPSTEGRRGNTTVSLVVVNQKLSPADLKRLAIQVHTSMARAIQPFATHYDGDVLYAVSTAELDHSGDEAAAMSGPDIGVLASETMWDAILASVPQQPALPVARQPDAAAAPPKARREQLRQFAGDYRFSAEASLSVHATGQALYATASGQRDVFALKQGEKTELLPVSDTTFTVPGRYPLLLDFSTPGELLLNPGHWQQKGSRVTAP